MGIAGGPNLNQDGLVFLYDVFDQDNSYKGEPTTNVVSNTNLDDGWAKGYHYDIIIGDTYPKPKGITSQAVSFRTANTYGYWYSYGNYAPQDDNTTYSISIWARTVGNSFYIQPYTADNSEAHRFWMSSQEVIGNGEWQRLTWPNAYTTPSSNDSDSLSFHFPSIPVGQRCWLLAPQLEPKSHVTPFIEGTRSSTQGLLDVAGTNQINISNVSFDANAQITFDGSNDSMVVSNNSALKNNNTSIEFVIKYLNTPAGDIIQFGVGSGTYAQYYYRAYSGNSYWNWYPVGTGYGDITIPNTALPINEYNHVVMTGDSAGYVQFYINGVAQSGAVRTANANPPTWTPADLTIGGFSWDGYSSSIIPSVKIYNRVLSAQEVLQNYNATKSRFNLK
jgi:hypothetical protein